MLAVRFAAGATRIAIVLMLALALPVVAQAQTQVRIEPQRGGVDVRLRGIAAVDADIAWASGRGGTVLRTRDGGVTWENVSVPGAEQLDFRDVEAFDADHAVVLSIGNGADSRIYRTANGGRNWILVLQNGDKRAFFDCMVFDGARGWMLGDPVDGRFQIHATQDGGRRWTLRPDGPQAVAGEAAFAASGTCIARGEGTLLVGGSGPAHLHVNADGDDAWRTVDTGMSRNKSEAGVFSIAAVGQGALAVGGDYSAERLPGNAALWSTAGATNVQVLAPPRGYRSGVACAGSTQACVAVGPTGVDAWSGESWTPVTDTGYDAIDLVGNTGWSSGDGGRIARIAIGD